MFNIHWKFVHTFTHTSYVLSIILLPFNIVYSTILLFGIVCMWSRLPGNGTPILGEWLLVLDLVDFFGMIIAINLGGIKGALFTIFINFFSKFTGDHAAFIYVFKDMIAVALTCLVIPYVHVFTKDIVTTMVLFTLIRALWFIPMQFVMPRFPNHQFIFILVMWTGALFVVNRIYANIFGKFFDNLLKTGVGFSWSLFIFISVIILGRLAYRRYYPLKSEYAIATNQNYQ